MRRTHISMILVDPYVVCQKNTHEMTLVVVSKKNTHAKTPVFVGEKSTHAMTPVVVSEKNIHAMTPVDPSVVSEENTHFNDTGGSICCL